MARDLFKEVSMSDNYYFISYKKENLEILREIVPKLDVDVWYDWAIQYTDLWEKSIAEHLLGSKAVLFFLSKAVLKQGKDSFPVVEYETAADEGKTILVIYLEDIKPSDVPDSLKFWYKRLTYRQCVVYEEGRSLDEWIATINGAIKGIIPKKEHPVAPALPKALRMNILSNHNDNTYMYLSQGIGHITPDFRKICLFNNKTNMFEVRSIENLDCLITAFKGDTAQICQSQIFLTPRNDFLYYLYDDCIHVFDVLRNKWKNILFNRFTMKKGEHMCWAVPHEDSDKVYFLAEDKNGITSMSLFNVATGKEETDCDLRTLQMKGVISHLKNRNFNILLYYDEKQQLMALDLNQFKAFNISADAIGNYYENETDEYGQIDHLIARDGQMYSVKTAKSFSVIDTNSGKVIDEEFYGDFRCFYLLKQREVLKFSSRGEVVSVTPTGRKTVFSTEFFKNEPAFEGEIPHTMYYDEIQKRFIFVVSVSKEETVSHKIVVLDSDGKVVKVSNYIRCPIFTSFICECKLVKNMLFVTFTRNNEIFQNARQKTFVFVGEYT